MKKVAGRLRLDLAQYRELEAFAAFGSDLDAASKAQLERGARLVELLKQPQYTPFAVEDEIVSIWAGTTGKLDDVPVEDIRRFERELLDFLHREQKGLVGSIAETKELSDDTVSSLEDAVVSFKKQFETSSGELLVKDEPVGALDESEVEQEKIKKHVRKQPAKQG
jgi:F-type H+-transporting ATPase subunit alpha